MTVAPPDPPASKKIGTNSLNSGTIVLAEVTVPVWEKYVSFLAWGMATRIVLRPARLRSCAINPTHSRVRDETTRLSTVYTAEQGVDCDAMTVN